MSRHDTLLVLLVGLITACETPEFQGQRSLADLRPGMWIEAQGETNTTTPQFQKVEQIPPPKDPNPKKFEITAAAGERPSAQQLTLMGRRVDIAAKTRYENLDRDEVSPYPIQAGDWLRIKLRSKAGGALRARTIRRVEARGQFKVEGAVTRLGDQEIFIGDLRLLAGVDSQIRLLGDRQHRARGEGPLSVFLEDEQKSVPFTIKLSEYLYLGGEFSGESEWEDEFNLSTSKDRDRNDISLGAKVDLLWILGDQGSFALFEGRIGRKDRYRENDSDSTTRSSSISRAYFYYRHSDQLRLQLGRQDFDDQREWLYDDVLDAVRLHSSLGGLNLELAAAAGRDFAEDEGHASESTTMISAMLRYKLDRHHQLTAYAIRLNDTSLSDFEPRHYGIRSYAKPSKGLGHWGELSYATGRAGTSKIEGLAYDVGLLYRFDTWLRPTLVLGYAYAPGHFPGGNTQGFRQTGLQDNNGKFGGVTSFRYYGEVLDPELANIDITTLGFGLRPNNSFSADLMLHSYRQDYKSVQLYGSELRTNPNGGHADLGWGADLILGYRYGNRVRGELVFGRFTPGSAFDDQGSAHKVQLQIRTKF